VLTRARVSRAGALRIFGLEAGLRPRDRRSALEGSGANPMPRVSPRRALGLTRGAPLRTVRAPAPTGPEKKGFVQAPCSSCSARARTACDITDDELPWNEVAASSRCDSHRWCRSAGVLPACPRSTAQFGEYDEFSPSLKGPLRHLRVESRTNIAATHERQGSIGHEHPGARRSKHLRSNPRPTALHRIGDHER